MNFDSELDKICTGYFEEFLYRFPVKATKLGIHRYDYRFGSFSSKDFNEWAGVLKGIRKKLFSLKLKKKGRRKLDYSLLEKRTDNEFNWVVNEREYETSPLMYSSTIKDGLLYSAFGSYAPLGVRSKNFLDRLSEIELVRKEAEENLQFSDYLEKQAALKEIQFLYKFVDEFSSYLVSKSDIERKDDFKSARVKSLGEINGMLEFIEKLPVVQNGRRLSFVKKMKREYFEDYPLKRVQLGLQNRLENLSKLIESKARKIKISQPFKETLKSVMEDKKTFTLEGIASIFDNIKKAGENRFGKTDSSVEFKLMLQNENRKFNSVKEISSGIILPLGPFDLHTTISLMLTSSISLPVLLSKLVSLGYPGKSYEAEIKKKRESHFRRFFENSIFDEGWKLYVERMMENNLKQTYGDKFELVFLYNQYEILFRAFIENELLNKRTSVEEFRRIVERNQVLLDKETLVNDVITENGKSLKSVIGLDSIMKMKAGLLHKGMKEREFHTKLLSHSSLPFKFIQKVLET